MGKKKSILNERYIFRVIVIMVVTTGVSFLLTYAGFAKENTLMVFMIGVLLTTAWTDGCQYGVAVSVLNILVFNFCFTEPRNTFMVSDPNDFILIVVFLATSLISYTLTIKFQRQLVSARENERTASLLYEMSESFINVTGKENIINLGIRFILEQTGFESEVELCEEFDSENVHRKSKEGYMMVPIIAFKKQLGVLKIYNHNQGLSIEQEMLIKTAANQIGIALDREYAYRQQENIKVEMEREHMKSRMLRSISHDFRTPLTGIIGDCGLIMDSDKLDETNIKMLTEDINEQAVWLMKMMENILNMTRIESGGLQIHKQEEVIDDIIYEAASHVRGIHDKRNFSITMPEELIVAPMDGKMMVQVLINLLDNALKHTKEGGRISILVFFRDGRVYIQVEDDGDGIAEGLMEKLFDEFVTSQKGDSKGKQGIGLGLAICKAVILAHGGKIWAENKAEGGARMTFWLNAERAETDGR